MKRKYRARVDERPQLLFLFGYPFIYPQVIGSAGSRFPAIALITHTRRLRERQKRPPFPTTVVHSLGEQNSRVTPFPRPPFIFGQTFSSLPPALSRVFVSRTIRDRRGVRLLRFPFPALQSRRRQRRRRSRGASAARYFGGALREKAK